VAQSHPLFGNFNRVVDVSALIATGNKTMANLTERSNIIERMKSALILDPSDCAVLTIDCQRGNLEPAIALLPVVLPENS
jgi:hypothetical protein